jgi:hypothetical protein
LEKQLCDPPNFGDELPGTVSGQLRASVSDTLRQRLEAQERGPPAEWAVAGVWAFEDTINTEFVELLAVRLFEIVAVQCISPSRSGCPVAPSRQLRRNRWCPTMILTLGRVECRPALVWNIDW